MTSPLFRSHTTPAAEPAQGLDFSEDFSADQASFGGRPGLAPQGLQARSLEPHWVEVIESATD